jgi:hypothetical protein
MNGRVRLAIRCVAITAAIISFGFDLAHSEQSAAASVRCVKRTGFLVGPVVPTAEVAREIYIAVARYPQLHKLERPGPVVVDDEGSKWGVSHYLPPKVTTSRDGKYETVDVMAGGGDLTMEIDKCTGAVLMSLNR